MLSGLPKGGLWHGHGHSSLSSLFIPQKRKNGMRFCGYPITDFHSFCISLSICLAHRLSLLLYSLQFLACSTTVHIPPVTKVLYIRLFPSYSSSQPFQQYPSLISICASYSLPTPNFSFRWLQSFIPQNTTPMPSEATLADSQAKACLRPTLGATRMPTPRTPWASGSSACKPGARPQACYTHACTYWGIRALPCSNCMVGGSRLPCN